MGSMPERLNIKVKPADPVEVREQDLIRRVQAGEKELFYQLVKPYERRIYAAAFAVLRNEAEAEDAAAGQDVAGAAIAAPERAGSRRHRCARGVSLRPRHL